MKKTKELGFRASLSILSGVKSIAADSNGKVQALADYLGVDVEGISQDSSNKNTYYVSDEDREYLVLNRSEAFEMASDEIMDKFKYEGLEAFGYVTAAYLEEALDPEVVKGIIDERAYNHIYDSMEYMYFDDLLQECIRRGIVDEDESVNRDDDEDRLREALYNDVLGKEGEDIGKALVYMSDELGMSNEDIAEDLLYSSAIDSDKIISIVLEQDDISYYLRGDNMGVYDGCSPDGEYYFFY